MDVYIDKKEKIWVMNLNPFDMQMNPGLFSYKELEELRKQDTIDKIEFRCVEEEGNTLPSEQLVYQLPFEMQTLSNDKVEEYISNLKKEE